MNHITSEDIKEYVSKNPEGIAGMSEELAAMVNHFAELIVRECVKVCADRGNHHDGLYSAWASDCSERIEKHFGIEE